MGREVERKKGLTLAKGVGNVWNGHYESSTWHVTADGVSGSDRFLWTCTYHSQ